jgi:hypothetical protein
LFTDLFPGNGRPIVARVASRGNVIAYQGSVRHNINPSRITEFAYMECVFQPVRACKLTGKLVKDQ